MFYFVPTLIYYDDLSFKVHESISMALVTVQLGQCGNQIGCQFYHSLINNMKCYQDQHSQTHLTNRTVKIYNSQSYEETALDRFFHMPSKTGRHTMWGILLNIIQENNNEMSVSDGYRRK